MTDILFLNGIKIRTFIGLLPWEQVHLRTVDVSVEMVLDNAQNDTSPPAVDYAELKNRLCDYCSGLRNNLIETLAEKIADFILHNFAVRQVTITLVKTGILPDVREVGIKITRCKNFQAA